MTSSTAFSSSSSSCSPSTTSSPVDTKDSRPTRRSVPTHQYKCQGEDCGFETACWCQFHEHSKACGTFSCREKTHNGCTKRGTIHELSEHHSMDQPCPWDPAHTAPSFKCPSSRCPMVFTTHFSMSEHFMKHQMRVTFADSFGLALCKVAPLPASRL